MLFPVARIKQPAKANKACILLFASYVEEPLPNTAPYTENLHISRATSPSRTRTFKPETATVTNSTRWSFNFLILTIHFSTYIQYLRLTSPQAVLLPSCYRSMQMLLNARQHVDSSINLLNISTAKTKNKCLACRHRQVSKNKKMY